MILGFTKSFLAFMMKLKLERFLINCCPNFGSKVAIHRFFSKHQVLKNCEERDQIVEEPNCIKHVKVQL